MASVYLLLFLFVATYALPVPPTSPEENLTEAEMTSKIRYILTALGYPQKEIDKALELVPAYYAEIKHHHSRGEQQAREITSKEMTTTLKLTQTFTPMTTPKPTMTTLKPTLSTIPSDLNSLLHQLDLFWKG